jgi:hypothetical protein
MIYTFANVQQTHFAMGIPNNNLTEKQELLCQ